MPIENFTTYTESDLGNKISATSSRATVTLIDDDDDDTYLAKDKGVNHFSGNFEHLLDLRITATAGIDALCNFWVVGDGLGDREAVANELLVFSYRSGGGVTSIYCYEKNNSNYYVMGTYAITLGTTYYLKIYRTGTTYGCKIYSDSARTNLLATLQGTLQAVVSYRYIYGIQAADLGVAYNNRTTSGYCENLDLQEPVKSGSSIVPILVAMGMLQ